MKEKIEIVSSPHTRPENQTILPPPKTETEFYQIVTDSDWPTLKQYGFRKWDTMNNVIGENITHQDDSKLISIPVFNASTPEQAANLIEGVITGNISTAKDSMLLDLSHKEPVPVQLLEHDEDIILFPGEWYSLIPDGFKCTSLYGEECTFIKGKSDDDIRFGCIAYGVRRKI
jgi:hypothetical protein